MIKPASILITIAILSAFAVSDAMATECKPYKKSVKMYRIVDEQGRVFFMGSPNHPACSNLIEKKLGTKRQQASEVPEIKAPDQSANPKKKP